MYRRFVLVLLSLAVPAPSQAQSLSLQTAPQLELVDLTVRGGPSAAEVLGKWLKLYHKGKLDLGGNKQARRGRGAGKRAKDFISISSGLFGKERLARMTHERELRLLCKATLAQQNVAAARALLRVAAVGLDKHEYATEQKSVTVRIIGEEHLVQITATEPLEYIVALADGKGVKGASLATRLAALRNLGARKDERYRPILETGIANSSVSLRLAAANGLSKSKLKTAVPALADQLLVERVAAVQIQLLDALSATARAHGSKIDDRDLRRAVTTALGILTKCGWNVDIATLDFLQLIRTADSVPRLIAMLNFYSANKRTGKSADHSATARYRAYDLLCFLTGAVFAIDRPDQWQRWWESNQDTFKLAKLKVVDGAEPKAGATSGAFFGIPVRGTRIVFIVDISTSMEWAFDTTESKIQVAKRQLKATVEKLSADSQFNMITFAQGEKSWKDKLVTANKANKKSFYTYVDRLTCGPYTNVWAGMKRGLELDTIVHGSRYATKVDEIFVLSDGAPTSGEIRDPKQILETVTEVNRFNRIRINTIFIEGPRDGGGGRGGRGGRRGGGGQPDWNMSGAELMKKIAAQNGGQFLNPRGNR